ncbi:MAG: hypothetical protein JWQ35_2078 [Bacteriovoracaceae bacterium]|nr:hypothetical protein [Bacteriovoracaceae bacterium]
MAKLHHPHAGLLVVRKDKQTMVSLTKDITTIGRKQADIILEDSKISSTHAEIRREGPKFFLKDLKSTNGTFLNRKPVTKCELSDQDVIEVGSCTLCFYEDSREFNGASPEISMRQKVEKETTKTKEIITNSKTLQQLPVKIHILKGPDQGKKFTFRKSHILIGRKDADVMLLDVDISRAHAMIEVFGGSSIFLRDLESTNGTFLNGRKIQCEKIHTGDEIGMGNTKLNVTVEQVS